MHDAFVQIWQRAGSFDPARGRARPWIYAVLRNRALNILRGEARTDLVEDFEPMGLASEEDDPESIVARLSEAGALRRCLERLEPARRNAVRARLRARPDPWRARRPARRAARHGEILDPALPPDAPGVPGMTRDDDLDRLAAEHVLGLLDGEDAPRAERLARDAMRASQAAVARWRERFAELDETARPQPLAGRPLAAHRGGLAPLQAARARRERAPLLVPDPRSRLPALWRSLAFWRVAGLASAAAALLLAVGLATLATRRARASRCSSQCS